MQTIDTYFTNAKKSGCASWSFMEKELISRALVAIKENNERSRNRKSNATYKRTCRNK